MSKELRELLNQLDNANKEANALVTKEGVTSEELTNASANIDLLQAKIDAQKKIDAVNKSLDDSNKEPANNSNKDNINYDGKLFVKAIADNLLKQRNQRGLNLSEKEMNIISEHVGEDGGYALPQDIQTKINAILKDTDDVYQLVDFEPVRTRTGSRLYEKRSKQSPMSPLTESKAIPISGETPQLQKFSWNLKDLGDFMSIPNDLLKFAGQELEDWIINWFVEKVRVTRNFEILYGVGGENHATGIFNIKEYESVLLKKLPKLAAFKKVKNVTLKNCFKATSKWIVNQDGFNYLDSLEDATGRPYLQPDPRNSTGYLFLGLPVVEYTNETIKTTDTYIPILLGDLNQAYKYVSAGNYDLATTNIGGGAFETNTTKARIMMNMDGGAKDTEAIIEIQIPVDGLEDVTPVADTTKQQA